MATSPYIHHYRDLGEQGLIQSITAETIFLGGRDVIYLPREDYNREDAIFGQATQLIFRTSFNVAMLVESTEGFEGEGEFYSKFGLDIKDRVTLSLSRKTWEELNIESASPVNLTNREDADGYDRLLLELSTRYTTQEDTLIAENLDRMVTEDNEHAFTTQVDDLVLEVQDLQLGIDRPIAEDSGGTREVNLIDEESGAGGPYGEIAYITMEEEDVAGTPDHQIADEYYHDSDNSHYFQVDHEVPDPDYVPERFVVDHEIIEGQSVNDRLVMEDGSGDSFLTEDTTQHGSRHRRPMEGDLIYFPYNQKCFQITFVEHESPFYPGGTLPQFQLTCDLLEYSNEIFITGIPEIDSIEDNLSQMAVEASCLTLEGGASGQFERGEIIRQTTILGTNDSNASSPSARVLTHDPNTGKLIVAPMTPGLSTGDQVFGTRSKAYTTLTFIIADGIGSSPSIQLEELQDSADEQAMNVELEQVAGDFIDFSEVDPFSEGNF
tara:strand:+ start:990 stop:2468 length:1479 start_codon:yes stop_codon:yes gene_type:complete